MLPDSATGNQLTHSAIFWSVKYSQRSLGSEYVPHSAYCISISSSCNSKYLQNFLNIISSTDFTVGSVQISEKKKAHVSPSSGKTVHCFFNQPINQSVVVWTTTVPCIFSSILF